MIFNHICFSFFGPQDPCNESLHEHSRFDHQKSPGVCFTHPGLRLQPKGQLRGLCKPDVWSCCTRRRKVGSSGRQCPLHHCLPLWPDQLLQVLPGKEKSRRCSKSSAVGGTGSWKTRLKKLVKQYLLSQNSFSEYWENDVIPNPQLRPVPTVWSREPSQAAILRHSVINDYKSSHIRCSSKSLGCPWQLALLSLIVRL